MSNNKIRKHFRRGKTANNGHPVYIYDKDDNDFKYIGITHAKITNGIANIELEKNPNPDDKKKSYIRKKPEKDKQNKFGRKLNNWSFSEKDKKMVKTVINKDKKK